MEREKVGEVVQLVASAAGFAKVDSKHSADERGLGLTHQLPQRTEPGCGTA